MLGPSITLSVNQSITNVMECSCRWAHAGRTEGTDASFQVIEVVDAAINVLGLRELCTKSLGGIARYSKQYAATALQN